MVFRNGAVLLLMLINLSIVLVFSDSELISVHVVFRHGARAPIEKFTSEEARTHFFRGPGQLTDEGIGQAKLVGQILRDRYVTTSFLDRKMLTKEVFFQSSGSERCLMTMNAAVGVMFPNATPPVQTMPRGDDFLLVPKYDCPYIMNGFKKVFNLTDKEFSKAKANIWEISERALQRAADQSTYLKDKDVSVISALILEKDAGLAVPAWFDDKAYEEAEVLFFNAIAVMAGAGPYYNPSWMKVKSGTLLNRIFEEIKQQIECSSNDICAPLKKFSAFSTHDILIMALLESLGIREAALGKEASPRFCSLVIFELWMIDGSPKVKVLYRKNPDETTLINLTGSVRNCEGNVEFCEPERFTSCCNEFITSEAKETCYGVPSTWRMNSLTWLLIGISIILFIIIVILSYFCIRSKRQRKVELKC